MRILTDMIKEIYNREQTYFIGHKTFSPLLRPIFCCCCRFRNSAISLQFLPQLWSTPYVGPPNISYNLASFRKYIQHHVMASFQDDISIYTAIVYSSRLTTGSSNLRHHYVIRFVGLGLEPFATCRILKMGSWKIKNSLKNHYNGSTTCTRPSFSE